MKTLKLIIVMIVITFSSQTTFCQGGNIIKVIKNMAENVAKKSAGNDVIIIATYGARETLRKLNQNTTDTTLLSYNTQLQIAMSRLIYPYPFLNINFKTVVITSSKTNTQSSKSYYMSNNNISQREWDYIMGKNRQHNFFRIKNIMRLTRFPRGKYIKSSPFSLDYIIKTTPILTKKIELDTFSIDEINQFIERINKITGQTHSLPTVEQLKKAGINQKSYVKEDGTTIDIAITPNWNNKNKKPKKIDNQKFRFWVVLNLPLKDKKHSL